MYSGWGQGIKFLSPCLRHRLFMSSCGGSSKGEVWTYGLASPNSNIYFLRDGMLEGGEGFQLPESYEYECSRVELA